MDVDLTLKNYRCFPASSPLRVSLRSGFTALVGANNSGKSCLFRFLFEFRNLFKMLSSDRRVLRDALNGSVQSFEPVGTSDLTEIFCNRTRGDLEIRFDFSRSAENDRASGAPFPQSAKITVPRNTGNWSFSIGDRVIEPSPTLNLAEDYVLTREGAQLSDLSAVADFCNGLAKAIYIGPFRNIVNLGSNEAYYDMRVGQGFVNAWHSFQTGRVKRHREAMDALTEDIRTVFGFKRLSIVSGENTLQLTIDGKTFSLIEVGSGMAQFILVLANAVIAEPSYVLIDEPELNLHPSLQTTFLDTLYKYTTHGVIFSTHSIGLARAVADRIYAFQQVGGGESRVKEFEDSPGFLSEFLGELSFSAYRELGFEKLLLVEGRHDMNTVRQLLRLWGKDQQFLVLHLGGDALINGDSEIELQELKRVCDNIVAVIDSERTAPGEALSPRRQAFVDLCSKVHIPCSVLERRATENYLSDRAVKAVKGPKYSALDPYEPLKSAALPWAKHENWQIASEMTRDDLKGTDLGGFLESL
ncbi:MAG: AAA family ATPase [Dehalococcoidia bacterium]|jgi:ABC-type cobalamin/Fe3+-siderophores transport system ATPase subunit